MTDRGLKRVCASCATKFYDLGKSPIVCPSCGETFTGDVQIKSRRAKSSIVPDTVKRDEIEEKNKEALAKKKDADENEDDDDTTVSLEDLNEDEGDDDDAPEDDLSDLEGDIDVTVEKTED